jgi:predicted membrane-bound mannosyltransferase
VEEVIHQQFAKVGNLPKEISNLDAEFYLWKSVLPAATVVVFILVVFFYRFQLKNNRGDWGQMARGQNAQIDLSRN